MKIKFTKQYNEVDCGITCMQVIMSYYDSYISIETLRNITDTDTDGTSALGITKGFNLLNIQCDVYQADNSIWHNNIISFPIIANIIVDQKFSHYCVIYGFENNSLLIFDPTLGKHKMSISDFDNIWTGIIFLTKKTSLFSPIKEDKSRLSSLIKLLKNHKLQIIKISIISMIITLIGILISYYSRVLIDWIIPNKKFSLLTMISIICIISIALSTILNILRRYLLEILGQSIGKNIMTTYLKHIYTLPLSFFSKRKTGDIISRFSDSNKVIDALVSFTISLFLDICSIVIIGIILLTINKQLFLITLGSLPFYFIIILGTSKKMIILNEKEMNKNAQLNTNFIQGIQGITTIKSYKGESDFIEKISTDIDNSFKVSIERSLYDSIIQNSKNFISMITSILVLWIGSNYVIKGNITIGELITFNSLSIFFSEPIQNIIQLQEKFQKATVANNRLDDIFSIAPENDKESYSKIPENWKYIYFNNVSFYHSTKSTNGINNINIKFPINKHIGIIGKSGSGKSTLAKLIVKFYMPNKGDIFIDNVNISTLDTNSIRSEIVYIPQQSFFFSGTIRDNLYLGLDEIPEDVELFTVLDYTGLTQYIDSLPLGIDTYIEENASNLSGGQKQKLAISRALLSKSRVIILDEATSAIDHETEIDIFNKIFTMENKTIIIISHNDTLINKCDLIYLMNDGNIKILN